MISSSSDGDVISEILSNEFDFMCRLDSEESNIDECLRYYHSNREYYLSCLFNIKGRYGIELDGSWYSVGVDCFGTFYRMDILKAEVYDKRRHRRLCMTTPQLRKMINNIGIRDSFSTPESSSDVIKLSTIDPKRSFIYANYGHKFFPYWPRMVGHDSLSIRITHINDIADRPIDFVRRMMWMETNISGRVYSFSDKLYLWTDESDYDLFTMTFHC